MISNALITAPIIKNRNKYWLKANPLLLPSIPPKTNRPVYPMINRTRMIQPITRRNDIGRLSMRGFSRSCTSLGKFTASSPVGIVTVTPQTVKNRKMHPVKERASVSFIYSPCSIQPSGNFLWQYHLKKADLLQKKHTRHLKRRLAAEEMDNGCSFKRLLSAVQYLFPSAIAGNKVLCIYEILQNNFLLIPHLRILSNVRSICMHLYG